MQVVSIQNTRLSWIIVIIIDDNQIKSVFQVIKNI